MAGVSQEVSADEALPLLARNVTLRGFSSGHPTEYLILLRRYLDQAAELSLLAGSDGVLRVSTCAQASPLLDVLGYRMKQACGPDASLETANPERAFLTVDSGFPLADLEEAIRGGHPFEYAYPQSRVPVLLKDTDWIAFAPGKISKPNVLDAVVGDLGVARLYWDLSRMDNETRITLRQSLNLRDLLPYVAALDYYGGEISIRSGKVMVPGGDNVEAGWSQLDGARPTQPGKFVVNLLAKDNGLLAAYFDAMSRVSQTQRAYFVDAHRLQLFYTAFRGEGNVRNLAKSIFVPYPELLILTTRLQVDSTGVPLVPGGVDAWKEIIRRKTNSKTVRAWSGRAGRWNDPQQVVEAMFAFTRDVPDQGPLQLFLVLSEMDRNKLADERLTPQTVRLLADKFQRFGDQYLIFSEFNALDNTAITRFLAVAEGLDRIRDPLLPRRCSGHPARQRRPLANPGPPG